LSRGTTDLGAGQGVVDIEVLVIIGAIIVLDVAGSDLGRVEQEGVIHAG
jgi:hypothetical protein